MLGVYEDIFAVVEGMRSGDMSPRRSIGTKERMSLPAFGNPIETDHLTLFFVDFFQEDFPGDIKEFIFLYYQSVECRL